MHIFSVLVASVRSFKPTTTLYVKPNLKIVSVENAVILSENILLPAKSHMHMFNTLITSVQSFKLIA